MHTRSREPLDRLARHPIITQDTPERIVPPAEREELLQRILETRLEDRRARATGRLVILGRTLVAALTGVAYLALLAAITGVLTQRDQPSQVLATPPALGGLALPAAPHAAGECNEGFGKPAAPEQAAGLLYLSAAPSAHGGDGGRRQQGYCPERGRPRLPECSRAASATDGAGCLQPLLVCRVRADQRPRQR